VHLQEKLRVEQVLERRGTCWSISRRARAPKTLGSLAWLLFEIERARFFEKSLRQATLSQGFCFSES
jgi:hypothetical protein